MKSESASSGAPTTTPSKQAIVYIIDTSPSMNHPYPKSDLPVDFSKTSRNCDNFIDETLKQHQSQTRLDAAKEACIGLITDLMLKSKTNECGVIILHTPETHHHLINDHHEKEKEGASTIYSHITELSPVRRPTLDLLKKLRSVQVATNADSGTSLKISNSNLIPHRAGGFCDGIMLAASAISKRTFGKRFQRKIILLTDAEREVDIHWESLDETVDGLRGMGCDLTVIGLDFHRSAQFYQPAAISSSSDANVDADICMSDHDNGNVNHNEDKDIVPDRTGDESKDHDEELEGDDDDIAKAARVKDDNEMFLISLTKYTGGEVHAASTVQQILKKAVGRRIPRSSLSKIEFQIAPGLTVEAKISLSTSKQSFPSLKREAVTLDGEGQPMMNAIGEVMSVPVTNITSHWDAENPDVEVGLSQRTTGYPYGSDLIPIGPMEMEGLKFRSPRRVTILGYTSTDSIKFDTLLGPTRIISGFIKSRKSCLAISAISNALLKSNQLAICTYVKTKDSDPVMGILVPLINENACTSVDNKNEKTQHLLFLQMPFADDVQNLTMNPLNKSFSNKAEKACDDLIDAFMIPNLKSESCPNPAIRSFRKTMIRRAMDPTYNGIVAARESDSGEYPMSTPSYLLDEGREELKNFRGAFPLELVEKKMKGRRRKKYFVADSQDLL